MIKKTLKFIDRCLSHSVAMFLPERASLLAFLFHGLFLNEDEIKRNDVDPQQRITVEHFRQFVKYYHDCGYTFISPEEMLKGLDGSKRYVLITFDDGYYNNCHALPVLEEFDVPAVFFIAANMIIQQKGFWWDILYRERLRQGVQARQIFLEGVTLKRKTADQIEKYLVGNFGPDCLRPVGPVDRPFTVEEFRKFAASRHVHIGNHTLDHAILTNYTPEGIRRQILQSQYELVRLSGKVPVVISYPNGSYSKEVLRVTHELGITMGITIDPKKNYLPLDIKALDSVQLGRFILGGDSAILPQCEQFRIDFSLYNSLKNFIMASKRRYTASQRLPI